MSTLLHTSEGLDWLFDTHLRAFAALNARPAHDGLHRALGWARLDGNEDCPTTIDLYSVDRHDAPVLRYGLSDDGTYYAVGIRPSL